MALTDFAALARQLAALAARPTGAPADATAIFYSGVDSRGVPNSGNAANCASTYQSYYTIWQTPVGEFLDQDVLYALKAGIITDGEYDALVAQASTQFSRAASPAAWLAQWKPIVDVVLGDFDRGQGLQVCRMRVGVMA